MTTQFNNTKKTFGKFLEGFPDFAEAIVRCGWYSACIAIMPSARVARIVANIPGLLPENRPCNSGEAARVRRALGRVERFWPLTFSCLARALAARAMLSARGCVAELHLGVALTEKKLLKAHAWLTAGPMVVTGKNHSGQFIHVGKFGHEK